MKVSEAENKKCQ